MLFKFIRGKTYRIAANVKRAGEKILYPTVKR